MTAVRYVLVTDGTSDRALLHVLDWLLLRHGVSEIHGEWADLSRGRRTKTLQDRLERALELYDPCDVLFVHRDAEARPRVERRREIVDAIERLAQAPSWVAVVPVRMTEAWLLCDEAAIRKAAGNPNGRVKLTFPPDPEHLPDPKSVLRDMLRDASETSGRRRKQLSRQLSRRVQRVAELINDFAPLRRLTAFAEFEAELTTVLAALPRSDGEPPALGRS